MAKVTGIGGVFFKAEDPEKLYEWYERYLGIERGTHGSVIFPWGEPDGMTVWAIFPKDTTYFSPGTAPFMINFRVDDIDALLEKLRGEGVEIDPKREEYEYGRFAWVVDPEGNRVELWEPPVSGAP